ncbi:unnamed protein product [Penicillium olsonii]|uniref:Uncharacterized protein n=1 Tax=Penicillium olsonii TaxID=99116 RepID=A0A9W4HRL2_PENOL|nr:unnamed protein product [Penicillium olsonii]CAG8104945.1 unnamed protein product [Penicillium olsonii]
MSHLQYHVYPGYGEASQKNLRYSQAVRIGDRIETSGQGGWDPETSKIPTGINAQIDQAFANVHLALTQAGGKGWSQVFRVNSYHLPLNDEAMHAMVRNFKKYMPDHEPLWTCIGVARLGYDDMRVEIEVVAHDQYYKAQ